MNILVVENDLAPAELLVEVLSEAGHEVLGPASCASSALAIAAHSPVDLALLDINLDGRSDGVQLARSLLTNWGVPAVFVSGDESKALGGADVGLAYLRKPYSQHAVLAAVEVAEGIIETERKAANAPGLELL